MNIKTFFYLGAIILETHAQNETETTGRLNLFNFQPTTKPTVHRLNFTRLAAKHGHAPKTYEVITEDGYILSLFHLPGKSPSPVLLMHGILDSADTWLLRGQTSLAITLANLGYDVWAGNTRGNKYSRHHTTLDPDVDTKFWDYSFNEVGRYDYPAIIDTILNETGASNISAIAHSQGNTAFLVMGSERPEYNSKLNVVIALAPVCYLHHSPPPISTFISLKPTLEAFIDTFKINEVLGDGSEVNRILRTVCPMPIVGYTVCTLGLLSPFTGFDPTETEPSFHMTASQHFPSGTSAKTLLHYLQIGDRKMFAPYDYGERNMAVYNSSEPPLYNLSKVNFPIALLAARNDPLSTIPDVTLLRQQLPNVVYYLVNPRRIFNHMDDIWGRRMYVYLFPYILRLLRTYNGF